MTHPQQPTKRRSLTFHERFSSSSRMMASIVNDEPGSTDTTIAIAIAQATTTSKRDSPAKSQEEEEPDVENPRPLRTDFESLRRESHRLSEQLASQTELSAFLGYRKSGSIPSDASTRRPPSSTQDHHHTERGKRKRNFWFPCTRRMRPSCIQRAEEHGGDYSRRLITATRVALGSGLTFAALVLPETTAPLGVVWVGNIWFHANISTSLGASLPKVIAFAKSIILTTVLSWPVAYALTQLQDWAQSLVFPFVIFGLSLVIMTIPQLTSNSLMLVVMYIILAAPLGTSPFVWWKPAKWVGTYLICLAIALGMNLFPFPNLALAKSHEHLERFEKDVTMLLLSAKEYSINNGTNVNRARQAISTMELMCTRIVKTIASLKTQLPATKVELRLLRWRSGVQAGQDLEAWIQQGERLLQPLQQLRSALMQKVLGEDSNFFSPTLAQAKVLLNNEIAPSRDRLVDAMVASVAVCHVWADPSEHNTILSNVKLELQQALQECEHAFHDAICKAAHEMACKGCLIQREQTPLFAHLTRRMSAFHSLFALAESQLRYLEIHDGWEDEEQDAEKQKICCRPLRQKLSAYKAFWMKPWKWHKQDDRRMALKTSLGMVFASFFVSMPYLRDIAAPYGVFPGITIASVNLSTTGSSFHKASDRLMATMIAGAFSMIVTDFFPGQDDIVKIVALASFTFVMIYLRNTTHAYMYTYSSISIGCMLFGSVKTNYDISGYIPKRIKLIFIGVIIFAFTELLIFPRSSRKLVESTTFEFCRSMRAFLRQAVNCSRKLEEYVNSSKEDLRENADLAMDMLQGSDDPFYLDALEKSHADLKAQADKLNEEISSAISEPSLGLGQPLHSASFRQLVTHQRNSERQAALLCNALKKLAEYYQEGGHAFRAVSSNWPQVHTNALNEASQRMDSICTCLESVFSDGRIRAQEGNSVKAVNAASTFRSLADVRLKIVSDWSMRFEDFVQQNGFRESEPEAVLTLGITITIILEICRHMQDAGKSIEEIAYHFPTFQ